MSKDNPETSGSLYAKREKIYPRQVHGIFAFWRTTGVFVLLGIYYILPWFQWDDRQAVLFDLPARKFYIFGLTFWPQDFVYLALLLIIAAVALFFFTAIAGRLWCGFACPQTVWTEIFLWFERKIEGDRSKQIKLDKAPWSGAKFMRKSTKHTVWIIFSLYTGFTFVGYFTPIQGLTGNIINWGLGPWETFWILFYSLATYGNAGFLREQVCIYMCPYARFQSAMFDKDTLIISYDEKRGEPRGSRKRGVNPDDVNLGACIDCTLCVQVCPTGIDIRDGLQYQCIACASCIDVCNEVMDKMGYPRDLVRYTTTNKEEGNTSSSHVVRARTVVYTVILALLSSIFVFSIGTRTPVQIDVIRDRRALYRETTEGQIENVYTLKIINMEEKGHLYKVNATGIKGLKLVLKNNRISVPAGEVIEVPVWVRVSRYNLAKPITNITFTVQSIDKPELKAIQVNRFIGPR